MQNCLEILRVAELILGFDLNEEFAAFMAAISLEMAEYGTPSNAVKMARTLTARPTTFKTPHLFDGIISILL
jgi:hypothetical protein